jgi:hypothetical protein
LPRSATVNNYLQPMFTDFSYGQNRRYRHPR